MSLRCHALHRKFLFHLEGRLPGPEAARMEAHLGGCRACGDLYAKIRRGDLIGREFARIGPGRLPPPPEFEKIRAKIVPDASPGERAVRIRMNPLRALATPLGAGVLVALVVAQAILLVISARKTVLSGKEAGSAAIARIYAGYHPLRIPDFPSNTRMNVYTEGVVREVYFDREENTLHLKLVEMDRKSEPFVICEILRPAGMTIPREGTRVRVYGVARFDAQPGREWHEVNPVLDLAVLKR
jgi:hypothetical protein